MSGPDLGAFWSENKERIGVALAQGVDAVAQILHGGADAFEFVQEVAAPYIHWKRADGRVALAFCVVPDPRDLDTVLDVYKHAKELQPALVAVFVHQWTDGEGNWDAFAIGPRRAMQHCDRICGTERVQQRGPELREDIYTLFACDHEFPAPGRAQWAELLAGPAAAVIDHLAALAAQHGCVQAASDHAAHWANPQGHVEAQFFLLPDPGDIDAYIAIYERIRATGCPVSFVFVERDEFRVYDIFRLSARSYLEHHNQARGTVRAKPAESSETKTLADLRWVPRWASHVGCIKGCLNYLGVEVSDAWLFGATGHAFVINISDGLCPSGPTDWNTDRFLELGRNIGYEVKGIDEWCPRKDDNLTQIQQEAWDYVRNCIDEGTPCYGWELVHPDYFVIYGYDETGYYVSGPGCDEGAGPIPWQKLGTSEIGVVLVAGVRPAEPADARRTVRGALTYALDLGHNRRKWTDRAGGLAGYDLWIETMEAGKAGRFGLGYNAAVWAESRQFAVEFLREARQRLESDLHSLFDRAIAQYEVIARNLKTISDAYPHQDGKDSFVKVDGQALTAIDALKQARTAEATGLDVLAELLIALGS
ncbi:MAG: hypothetical protein JSW27_17780 [Phycisphaerales bacterium]|nr:MAG: hypothetical protein JSW27_17780 [Phycisphaerales bacterium]